MADTHLWRAEAPVAPEPPPRSWGAVIGATLFAACVYQALWMIYVSNNVLSEWLLGLLSTALSVAASIATRHVALIDARPRRQMLKHLWRVPGEIASDTVKLVAAVVRRLLGEPYGGHLQSAPFTQDSDPARAAGQRMIAMVYPSLSPNSIVLGVLAKSNRIVFHQLFAAPVGKLLEQLGTRG